MRKEPIKCSERCAARAALGAHKGTAAICQAGRAPSDGASPRAPPRQAWSPRGRLPMIPFGTPQHCSLHAPHCHSGMACRSIVNILGDIFPQTSRLNGNFRIGENGNFKLCSYERKLPLMKKCSKKLFFYSHLQFFPQLLGLQLPGCRLLSNRKGSQAAASLSSWYSLLPTGYLPVIVGETLTAPYRTGRCALPSSRVLVNE